MLLRGFAFSIFQRPGSADRPRDGATLATSLACSYPGRERWRLPQAWRRPLGVRRDWNVWATEIGFGPRLGRRRTAAAFKKAGQAIFGDKQSGTAAGFLQPIDTERIARTLRLDDVAAENGRKIYRRPTAKCWTRFEQSIVQPIEAEWTLHGGELINHLRAYAQRLIGFSIDAEFQRLNLKANDALASLRAAHIRAEAELGHLLPAYLDARREYEQFRERHRLQRPVRNQGGRWTAFGLLIVLVAVESVLNGFFFAKGSEFGLVGGVGTAIGISLCNVAVAFALGLRAVTMDQSSQYPRKAHWLDPCPGRDGFARGFACVRGTFARCDCRGWRGARNGSRAREIQQSPWVFADLSSYYLFGLGVLFGLLALWKGYSFDDPYPAYGSHARRMETASQLYGDEHRSTF